MSSIQSLVGKIEKNQKKNIQTSEKTRTKKEVKKLSPEEIEAKRAKFSTNHSAKQSEKKTEQKKNRQPESSSTKKVTAPNNLKKKKKGDNKKKRFFVTQVCTSKKSCGEKMGPYVWERLCNDYNQDPNCESFEIQGFLFEKSPCQGACKKSANIRMKEENAEKHTQFSYLSPIKASKLIKMIKSGASPENIKRI